MVRLNVPSVHRKQLLPLSYLHFIIYLKLTSLIVVLTFVSGATRSSYTYTCPKFKWLFSGLRDLGFLGKITRPRE